MPTPFDRLFQPIEIGNLIIRNRICMTGHGTAMPTDGTPNDQLIAYYEERAKGEVGLIMLGSQQVHPSSPGITGLLCNYDDRIIPGLSRLAKAVQPHGTKIFGYLSHMGFASSARPAALWSASARFDEKFGEVAHEMTVAEIDLIVRAHAEAALRCIDAGLDGIEIHCGHGLLVQQFLSPLSNQRTDDYGGSQKKRTRFAEELLAAVRRAIGPDVPLGIRCSVDELVPGGLDEDAMAKVVPWLVQAGKLDFVDISAGNDGNLVSNMLHEPPMGLAPGPFRTAARRIKQVLEIDNPEVVTIHGTRIHTAEQADQMLAVGDADMAGMARPLIADAHLPRKARTGLQDQITPCIACEQACFGRLFRGRSISCLGSPLSGREHHYGPLLKTTPPARRILVVGGGPAGMEAALVAAERGHRVTLMEKGSELGGRLNLAKCPPGRQEWQRLIDHKRAALVRAQVSVELNRSVTAERLDDGAFDHVIVATGARPRPLEIEGISASDVLDLDSAIADWVHKGDRLGRRLVILDGLDRAPALASAIGFARSGHEVTLVTSALHVGAKLEIQNLTHLCREALLAGVTFLAQMRPALIAGDLVVFDHILTRERGAEVPFDTLISAMPGLPHDPFAARRRAGKSAAVSVIGDAFAPRDAEAAILDGFQTGVML